MNRFTTEALKDKFDPPNWKTRSLVAGKLKEGRNSSEFTTIMGAVKDQAS